jgi:hypothetical protein
MGGKEYDVKRVYGPKKEEVGGRDNKIRNFIICTLHHTAEW